MTRAYNFSPGPAMLPDEVMQTAQREFCEYADLRASVMEISHRSDAFLRIRRESESLLRELMDIPPHYWTLFLSGGATGQAAAAAMNLTGDAKACAAYVITGHWSRRAAAEAEKYCNVHIAADTAADGHTTLPAALDIPPDAVYAHIASNETIHGVQFPAAPDVPAPLVADLSSDILARRINVSDYALIYAAAQKNLGPAGVTAVIVRPDMVRPQPQTPAVWDYRLQQEKDSMLNTPPTFQLYMAGLYLQWMKRQGGVDEMEKRNRAKAALIYDCLDNSDFYKTRVAGDCRSIVNIPFSLPTDALTTSFLRGAEQRGLLGLKGHRVLGGCRVSLYNAMPVAGAQALADWMREFEQKPIIK